MDVIHLALSLFVLLLALAIFTNNARAAKHYSSTLHPNCLLTRWPLLFVTGPRSFFYFSSYWNIYTSYLAEHGYEVFNLRLPWSNYLLRRQRFLEFLEAQEKAQRKFHLVMDEYTWNEFSEVLQEYRPQSIVSLTEVTDPQRAKNEQSLKAFPIPMGTVEILPSKKVSFFVRMAYSFHHLLLPGQHLPTLSALGACKDTCLPNARLLLERSQVLAEMDLREG